MIDVNAIRDRFPALERTHKGKPLVYFDGPSGTQVVDTAIEAYNKYFNNGNANRGGPYPTSKETDVLIRDARAVAADFLGSKPHLIAFGANMTTLAFEISRALAREWQVGDEIVVTQMDHTANVDPWVLAAEDRGVKVQWIGLDTETLTLDYTQLDEIITTKTKLVAIGHASNGIGTINEIEKVIAKAKAVNAVTVLDAVHSAPHLRINQQKLGVDIVLCSAYKFYGPHIGILSVEEDLFKRLRPYKVRSASNEIPFAFENGTPNFGSLLSTKEAIEFIASLGAGEDRSKQITNAFERIAEHENKLANYLRDTLGKMKHVTLYQATTSEKTPTLAFRVQGKSPREVATYLAEEHAIAVGNGHFYAETIGDVLDLNSTGGWIRVGIVVYNTREEIERLIQAIQNLA